MDLERSRIISLIDFSQQSARLRGKPAATVSGHGQFSFYEHEIQGLPGIRLNPDPSSLDEIWLAVERLHERKPPEVTNPTLRPWVKMTQSPTEDPRLRDAVDGASLIVAGTHCIPPGDGSKPMIATEDVLRLSEYSEAELVHASFATYLDTKWRPWAEEEKRRRRTIRLYAQLFTLQQQLEGSIVESPLELVWGAGVGIWNCDGTTVNYPLIARLAEVSLNTVTAEIEIRPRDIDARVELDWYASVDNAGVGTVEKFAREFFASMDATFSPFDRATFEPLLRTAATNLDVNGAYWPDEVPPEDRSLPKADGTLRVTDTWVLFARPRTTSVFIQDLENLRKRAEECKSYPPAVLALVTDLETSNPVIELPVFRGVSAPCDTGLNHSATEKARDIYFPKPFNDEQLRIIQLLEVSDGVIVQGPPGTGKTHTIANVICHYLAEGKRVLVTSMKDPALREVQEKLPDEIRPLAISLLSSEQEGMKQFEHAIQRIASEVQSIDRVSTARTIRHLEDQIDQFHSRLVGLDLKIRTWAKRNLSKITIDNEQIDPQEAAREITGQSDIFDWLPDTLGIGEEFDPQFVDADIARLRDARRLLGKDIDYLGASLPALADFPDSKALLSVHRDLAVFEKLKQVVDRKEVPELSGSNEETLTRVNEALAQLALYRQLREEIVATNRSWTAPLRIWLRGSEKGHVVQILEDLGTEIESASNRRRAFLERPVVTPPGIELDSELVGAVTNLADARSAFGFMGLLGKSAQKKQLGCIRVLGQPPSNPDAWKLVAEHLALSKCFRQLAVRWNAVASELHLDRVEETDPSGGVAAGESYALYRKVKHLANLEHRICQMITSIFPGWQFHTSFDESVFSEFERALNHHVMKIRLANIWITKEQLQKGLDGRSGRIVNDIRSFFNETLGNIDIEDAAMQAEWSRLMTELSRVSALRTHLNVIDDVCSRMEASGAPRYAAALRNPVEGTIDRLLPNNWRVTWRLRRLAAHLETIDPRQELKKLADDRRAIESDLARAYQEIVVRRTWLKLAENASPSIRAALQAYLSAIQKIGKGTGKRATRYRQDARAAAGRANPAVPCWIMPHYRVSESLPAELGCFDLVIVDEASQSDLTALPSLLRAKKVLIVGDDKQVSPEGVGLEEEKIRNLMNRFLADQVETFRPQMSPERSIYDLFKVVFAKSAVMLKEHFRCVGPIIEYSKREFYNHELHPLRLPKSSERLDPPLIDVLIEDGYRKGDINLQEAQFIVTEIKAIVEDPLMARLSIGVVSLLGDKQAFEVWERLAEALGPEVIRRHQITCGDARTFQGKERNIMFLSMVSAPNNVGAPLSRDTFEQRFNVAASRARDRMYLVRSVTPENLSNADRLRRSLIAHFALPLAKDELRVEQMRSLCESPFEREVYDELTQRGYCVTPQVKVGQYRIDMVVEGANDARMAVECDGDKYHGSDKWEDDMQRQRVLERAGWVFWRCFASVFIRRREEVIAELLHALAERGIEPFGSEGAPRSVHTEFRVVNWSSSQLPTDEHSVF
jgi:very-short-patch-repair endonuclease/Cdc6-like AAA superfamily ATPase